MPITGDMSLLVKDIELCVPITAQEYYQLEQATLGSSIETVDVIKQAVTEFIARSKAQFG